MLHDCRYALRVMWRSKGFSVLILFALALGIGVNTAVFSIVNAEIIKPLPFHDSSRLLVVWDTYLPQFSKVGVSPAELEAWRAQKDLFQDTSWYRYVPQDGDLSVPGSEPVVVHADFVSENLFPMLGISSLAGRQFRDAEDPWSALISEHLWRTHFDGNPDVVGKSVRFNDRLLTIVGVMPTVGQYPDWADIWLPKGPCWLMS